MRGGGYEYYIECLINIFTRFSVPCFVMMSGAFNLNRDRIDLKKIFIPTICILLLQIPIEIFWLGNNVKDIVIGCIDGSFNNFWFMYMLFGLYLITPFLVILKAAITEKQYGYMVNFIFIWAIISQAVSRYKVAYAIGNVFSYLGYYLLGDVLIKRHGENTKVNKVRCILSICFLCLVTFLFRIKLVNLSRYSFEAYTSFFSPTVSAMSIIMFCLFLGLEIKGKWYILSGYTFYIYLFHTVVIHILIEKFDFTFGIQSDLVRLGLLTFATFGITLVLAMLFDYFYKKIEKYIILKGVR